MSLHLITGHVGHEHITSADHGAFHNALLLSGSYVLNSGNKFSASVITNNTIKISDGELIMQGRHVRLKPGEYEEVTIENGAQDSARIDLIVARYVKDGTTGIENVSFVVIKGASVASNPSVPAHIEGNILNGVLTADFPLYRVPVDGLNVGELVTLFEVKDSFDARIKAMAEEVKSVEEKAGKKSTVALSRDLTEGTKIGTITIDGVKYDLYAPTNTDTTYNVATSSTNGLLSKEDKAKLDEITANADAVSFTQSLTSGTKVGTININGTDYILYAPTNSDTKNTAGSTNTSSKIFLIGATSQAANPQTYSHDTCYIGTDGCLYSNNTKVAVIGHTHAASEITAGTLGGKVQANASAMATLTNAQVRDSVILDSDPGEGATVSYNPGTIVWTK